MATLWNITIACNVASADFVISSPLLTNGYRGTRPEGYDQQPVSQWTESILS